MVSGREAVRRLLAGSDPERVALTDSPWGDTLASWVGQGYPTRRVFRKKGETFFDLSDGKGREAPRDGEYEEPVPAWEHFGYDIVSVGGWFDVMPNRGYSELVEETDQWEVKRNGAGAALKYWKHKSGTPEHIDFLMSSRAVWERDYRPRLLPFDLARLNVEGARKSRLDASAKGRWTHYGHVFVWELMRQSMGDIVMYESLLLDPGWIRDYTRVYTDMYKTYFATLIEQAGLPDGMWLYEDLGYRNGLFAAPEVLADLVFPCYRELVSFFHDRGLPVILHSCGSTVDALEMIVEAGFDGLNPLERKARGNEPLQFAERFGDRLLFVGGLDARVFESNDRTLIEREVSAYIDGMKARGARLVFASDHSISPNTRYASYQFALDVYRKHMRY
jgi:uroporphyrinogen decarboxylase